MILRMEMTVRVAPLDGQASLVPSLQAGDATWLSSLIAFGQDHGLYLTTGGFDLITQAGAPLPFGHLHPGNVQRLVRHRITTLADLRRWNGVAWEWRGAHPVVDMTSAAITSITSAPAPQDPTPFTRGQIWYGAGPHPLTHRPECARVFEVREATVHEVTCVEWTCAGRANTFANILTCQHTIHHVHMEEWNEWLANDAGRIYAHPINANALRVGDSAASLAPTVFRPTHALFPPHVRNRFDEFPSDIVIFTDGSWRQAGLLQHQFFYPDGRSGIGEAGIVIASRSLQWSFPPIFIRITGGHLVGAQSSYGMEFLGLVTALLFLDLTQCRQCAIVTDSQSAISLLMRPTRGGDAQRSQFMCIQSARKLLRATEAILIKVRAHPESRGPSSGWSFHEWGNHLADHVASGSDRLLTAPPTLAHTPFTITDIPAAQVLLAAGAHVPFYWSTELGPTLHTPGHVVAQASLAKYLATREQFSADIHRHSQWATAPVAFASTQWDLNRLSRSQRAASVRVMFDKGWHGRNRSKIKKLSPAEIHFLEQCPLCGAPSETAEHWIRECTAANGATIRLTLRAKCEVAIMAEPTIPPVRQVLTDALSLALDHPQGAYVWTGMWPPHLQQDLALGSFSSFNWAAADLTKLRNRLQRVGRILAWGASAIWKDRGTAPLLPAILAGLADQYSGFAHYYPAFNRGGLFSRGVRTVLGRARHQQFSPLPSQAPGDLSLQQHRDRIRNANQRDRRALTTTASPVGRLLTAGLTATLVTEGSSAYLPLPPPTPLALYFNIAVVPSWCKALYFFHTNPLSPTRTWQQPPRRPPFYFTDLRMVTEPTTASTLWTQLTAPKFPRFPPILSVPCPSHSDFSFNPLRAARVGVG